MDREVIFEHRKVSFMDSGLAKSANEFLSQRSQTVVNLRKQKRLESVRHKRIKQTSSPNSNLTLERVIHELDLNAVWTVKNLRKLLCQRDFEFHKLIQLAPNIIDILIPGFTHLQSELAFEVSWCFTNLAMGPSSLINQISRLVPLISSFIINPQNKMLAEQACWILGNLAADSLEMRDSIRQVCGLVKGISALLQFKITSLSAITCWTLCNLIRGCNPDMSLFVETGVLGPVLELTYREQSSDQCVESLWFLSLMTNNTGPEAFNQILQETNLTRLMQIVSSVHDPKIIVPILRIFGNALLYQPQIDCLFRNSAFIDLINTFLQTDEKFIQRETAWLLSNMFSCPREYTEMLMNSTMGNEIIEKLIDLLDHDFQDISTECGIALYNICEVQKSKHLLRVLRIDNNAKLLAYYQVIVLNVPVWLKLGIHGHSDVDLLKASLGFYQLCFELASLDQLSIPEANYSKLMSSETNEALESCEFVFANPDLRGANEQLIRALCSDMLKRYCEPSDRFVFS